MWPVRDEESLSDFITDKLKMDKTFLDEMGQVKVRTVRDPRSKLKDEAMVTFESKQVRDAVKAKASGLANYREEAGIRLHIPDYLQKYFKLLMNLAYDLKQKHRTLRRNVKFDEEEMNLFMDIQMTCLLYTSPSPRDRQKSRMPSSA